MGLVSLRKERRKGIIYLKHNKMDLHTILKGVYIVSHHVEDGQTMCVCYHESFAPLRIGQEPYVYKWSNGNWLNEGTL